MTDTTHKDGHAGEEVERFELGSVRPVRRGYEQVAEQLRARITSGELLPGVKLPSEDDLAWQFQASRSTIREALRLLAAWKLIRVTVGRHGGAYVAHPTVAGIVELIGGSVAVLRSADTISLDAVLEARELIEVPAAGLAAERWSDQHLEDLRRWIVDDIDRVSDDEQQFADRHFHSALLAASGNPMVAICGEPALEMVTKQRKLIPQPAEFRSRMCRDHQAIVCALEMRNANLAQMEMRRHLEYLRPFYTTVPAGRIREA